jgi:hypothetical protein
VIKFSHANQRGIRTAEENVSHDLGDATVAGVLSEHGKLAIAVNSGLLAKAEGLPTNEAVKVAYAVAGTYAVRGHLERIVEQARVEAEIGKGLDKYRQQTYGQPPEIS